MVHEAKEGVNLYTERSSLGIFGAIQVHVGDNPRLVDLPEHEKRPKEDYKEYAVRWKNVASLVRPPFTNREENSMFVDTLPSPYYDMLVVNDFVEFEDLMYSVGRIEDGIRRGKIVDTEASIQEKKMIILNEHNGGLNKRKPSTIEEFGRNLSRSSLYTPYTQVP